MNEPLPINIDDADLLDHNKRLAEVLSLIGNYYTMAGDTYRAKSFDNASTKIAQYPFAILSGSEAIKLFSGIGPSIGAVIDEYLTTGHVGRLQELEKQFQDRAAIIDYFRSFYGIGPVTAVKFYNLGFRTLEDIWLKGNLTNAQKTGILWRDHLNLRISRDEMDLIRDKIGSILNPYGIKWEIAGSYRRQEPSSGDIDILVEQRDDFNMEGLLQLLKPLLPAALAQGTTKFMGIIRLDEQHNGHRIDIRLINNNSYPFALLYFTGSQRFNILMRQKAIELGLRLNEYGLYDNKGELITANSEEEIFHILRLKYIPPIERTKTIVSLQNI